jgi:hypothetical protein
MKIVYALLVGMFAAVITSCARGASNPSNEMINPGDEIDGMQFTTSSKMDWDISLVSLCDMDSVEESETSSKMSCYTSPGERVFFGNCAGVWFDDPEEADKLWEEFNLEVTFDGQMINLPQFGYLDIALLESDKKYARIWNLLVEDITPGMHIIECKEKVDGDTLDTRSYYFEVSE